MQLSNTATLECVALRNKGQDQPVPPTVHPFEDVSSSNAKLWTNKTRPDAWIVKPLKCQESTDYTTHSQKRNVTWKWTKCHPVGRRLRPGHEKKRGGELMTAVLVW